ncbi:MAG: putative Ig domain-containing protein [Usitatibacter sp.]
MATLKRLLALLTLILAMVASATAHAECGGTIQCISIGLTPAEANTNHHGGGSGTFTMTFANQVTGTTSASITAYVAAVTGPAGSMADLGVINITGADAFQFSITGGTCSDTNGPVHGGSQCTVTVAFNPTAVGAKSAIVHVPLDPPTCVGCITERTFTVTGTGVAPPPVITSPVTASGTVGVAFAGYQITATNSPTSLGASGLPAGLSVNASGFISGTPTTAGTFNSTITATNSSGSDSKTLVFTINPPAPVITSPGTATGTGGQSFSYQITATNSPTTFGATGLPPGVSVSTTTGLMSGTPTAAGTFNATVNATNVTGTGSQPVTITISLAAPVITSPGSASGTGGQPFTYQITAANLASSYGASGLPAGLTVDTASGLISGTPAVTGTFSATITAANSAGTGSQGLTITIALATPVITSPVTASGSSGAPFSYQITASNLPTSYGATGLPTGLSVNASTGLISGTPIVSGSFNATISATNSAGTGGQALTISLAAGPPVITSAATASGIVTQPFGYQITATNFPASYGATGLPAGLSVNTGTGLVSGTPTAAGTFNVTVSATNSVGTGSQAVAMTFALHPPVITSTTTANGFFGTPFSYQITASNLPTSFGASGLPSGLVVNSTTGVISGTPTAGGVFPTTITASNASGTGSATLSIAIGNVPGPAVGNRSEIVAYNTPTRIDLASSILNSYTSVVILSGPSQGTATLDGSVVTYTPAPGYIGPDSFVYTASGQGGTSSPATVSITVGNPPAPTAGSRAAAVAFETATAIDLAGSIGGRYDRIAVATLPDHGLVSVSGTVVTYTPAQSYFGEDRFTYTATGPGGTSAPGTITVTVGSLAPSASAATLVVPLNTATSLDLRPFTRGSGVTRVVIVTQPARGRVSADGTRVTYTPINNLFGSDSFTYAAVGALGTSAAATVSVTIVGRPDPTREGAVTGVLTAHAQSAQRFAGAQIDNFQRRMESLHRGEPGPASPRGLTGAVAALAGSRLLDLAAVGDGAIGRAPERTHFWIGGTAQFGRRDAGGTLSGLDFTTSGVSLGADRRIGERFVLGLGAGAARDKTEIGTDGSESRARGISAAIYGSFQPSHATFVDAILGAGKLDLESRRFVPPASATAQAQRDGRQLFASVAAGYEHRRNGVMFSPYGRLDYLRDRFDAMLETGAGEYALAYSGQTATSVRGAAGLRAETLHETRFGSAIPRARVEYRHDFRGERTTSIAYADLADGPQFTYATDASHRNTLLLGLGADFALRGGLTVGVDYQFQRASGGQSDQGIRLNFSQAIFGTGSAAWLDGFALEPTRPLDLQVDAGFTYDDNVTRALSEADKRADRSFAINVRKSVVRMLSPHLRAVMSGSLGGEKFQYHNGLSRLNAGAKGELQYRPSGSVGAPTFALSAKAATEQYESRLRDGERYSASASVRMPLTDRIGAFGAVFQDRRHARGEVFDGRQNGMRVNLDWAFGSNAALYLGAEHRRGDHVTSANPFGGHGGLKHDGENRQVVDDAFLNPSLTTARFEGRSWLATLGYNVSLGPRDALDFSWRRVRTRPEHDADLIIGFYAPVPPVRYDANQFFILYLLSF